MMTNLQTAITRGLAEVIENIGVENIMNGIQMITDLLFGLLSAFGQVLGGIVGLATGAEGAEEQFTEGIVNMINTAVDFIITTAPQILIALATGIVKAIPLLVAAIPQILSNFKSALVASAPQLKAAGIQLLKAVITGIKSILSSLPAIGKQIVQGLWNGLKSSLSWIKSMIKGWVGNVKSFLKKLFGISSPSKWARDEIGYNIARGLAGGITQNAGLVDTAMQSLLPSTDVTLGAVGTEMANAVGTGMALANTGNIGGGTYQFVINLGGVKVAEQIYRLSEQGKMVLVG
jgi:phage-related protein